VEKPKCLAVKGVCGGECKCGRGRGCKGESSTREKHEKSRKGHLAYSKKGGGGIIQSRVNYNKKGKGDLPKRRSRPLPSEGKRALKKRGLTIKGSTVL